MKARLVSSVSGPASIYSLRTGCNVLLTNICPLLTISTASLTYWLSFGSCPSILIELPVLEEGVVALQSKFPFVQFAKSWFVKLNSGYFSKVGSYKFLVKPILTKPIWFITLIKGLGGGKK